MPNRSKPRKPGKAFQQSARSQPSPNSWGTAPGPDHKAEAGQAELEVSEADLNVARAKLNRAVDLFDCKLAARPEVGVAEAEVLRAEAQFRLAKAQYERSSIAGVNAVEKPPPTQLRKERLTQILAEEIQVAEDQAKLMREQHKAGTATFEASLRAELDVLVLKREAARLGGNTEQARELIGQQIHALEDLESATRAQRRAGVASEADELKLLREILSLRRQQAELE